MATIVIINTVMACLAMRRQYGSVRAGGQCLNMYGHEQVVNVMREIVKNSMGK